MSCDVQTPLAKNGIYFVVYKTACHLVFRTVGPLLVLTVLNFCLGQSLRDVRRRRKRIAGGSGGRCKAPAAAAGRGRQRENITTMVVAVIFVFIICELPDVALRLTVTAVQLQVHVHACKPFDAQCCHMGTAIKHPVPDRVKPSFVIFDIRAL